MVAEYIDRQAAIMALTALETWKPPATLTDAKWLLAHMPGIEILKQSPSQSGASPELERMGCPVCGLETMVGTRASNGHFHGRCEACGAKMHE